MSDREIKKLKNQICCILNKLPSLAELVFFSNEGTNDLLPLAVPGILGKLYIDINTGEQWMANPTGGSPYYLRVGKDVIEVASYVALPATGETGKIYVTTDNNKIYRWTGSTYVDITAKDITDDHIFEFKSGVLTTSFDAGYHNMKINSITNISNSPITTITTGVGLVPYTLGTQIPLGTVINVTVSTASTIRLNYTK